MKTKPLYRVLPWILLLLLFFNVLPEARAEESAEVIRHVKEQLTALHYLRIAGIDDTYDPGTAAAVHLFKSLNGIDDSGCMDPAECPLTDSVLSLLDEPLPVRPDGPPLTIPANAILKADITDEDSMNISVELRNESWDRTVTHFTLCIMGTDLWGEDVFEPYELEMDLTLNGGDSVFSESFTVYERQDLVRLYINPIQCILDTGEIVNCSMEGNDLRYFTSAEWYTYIPGLSR